MKNLKSAALHLAIIFSVIAGLNAVDPQLQSRTHGWVLGALAMVFIIQESVFHNCHKKLYTFLLSDAIPIDALDGFHERVRKLDGYITLQWWVGSTLRAIVIVIAAILTQASSGPTLRFFLCMSGYVFLFAGLVLLARTYIAYRHVLDESTSRILAWKVRLAGEKTAKELLDAKPPSDDSHSSGYKKAPKLKPE